MHKSVRLETPCEFINVVPVNPLISKCQIKVCYVGDEPNRNRSVITKDVARQMANSLPGSPIVGFFNEDTGDFEEHNRTLDIKNGKLEIKDATRPYGFVDLNAKVWFQKYLDDDTIEREYLVTEGYLWTGQYPECQRAVDKGNNESMELDKNHLDANWTNDSNGKPQFFIINEAIISKLCILGEDYEPCFEGSSVTNDQIQFSFADDFKEQLFSMISELKELLQEKGGTTQVFTTYAVTVGDSLWNALYSHVDEKMNGSTIVGVYEDNNQKFAVLKNGEKYSRLDFSFNDKEEFVPAEAVADITDSFTPSEEAQFALADVEAFETEYKKKKEEEDKEGKSDSDKTDDTTEGEKDDTSDDSEEDPKEDPDEDEKKKKKTGEDGKKAKYSLEEIPEYLELQTKFSALQTTVNTLTQEKAALEAQLQPLIDFRNQVEKEKKEEMIKSFYMLSEEDKADVVANIDKYSLDDIEAKLSILCVRNKVSFNLDDDNDHKDPTTYNLNDQFTDTNTPAWIKAAMDVAKTMN
jgi:hypothetical protein